MTTLTALPTERITIATPPLAPADLPAARNILGMPVLPVAWDNAIRLLTRHLEDGRFTKIGFLNAHVANLARSDRHFAETLRDFVILPDGIGVDLASRILYGTPFPANLNGTDFVPSFFTRTKRPLTVALLGTTRENAERASKAFERLAPQHTFLFMHDGFFTPEREARILNEIKLIKPDVLLVAMGVPRQEFWIAEKITAEHCTMAFAVGALLDFMSGCTPRAPGWVRHARMEWLYRLKNEPRRLFRRYVLGNPLFILRVFGQKLARHA